MHLKARAARLDSDDRDAPRRNARTSVPEPEGGLERPAQLAEVAVASLMPARLRHTELPLEPRTGRRRRARHPSRLLLKQQGPRDQCWFILSA